MKAHWQYLKYVLRHKWFVFVAGLRTGAPLWRLVIHDWSKFLPSEWAPYVRNFYGDPAKRRPGDFERAWNLHQKRQPHHWQFWLMFMDRPSNGVSRYSVLPMPDWAIREMVADWMGAGRAITGRWEANEWYAQNREFIVLDSLTRLKVEALITEVCGNWQATFPAKRQPGPDKETRQIITKEAAAVLKQP